MSPAPARRGIAQSNKDIILGVLKKYRAGTSHELATFISLDFGLDIDPRGIASFLMAQKVPYRAVYKERIYPKSRPKVIRQWEWMYAEN